MLSFVSEMKILCTTFGSIPSVTQMRADLVGVGDLERMEAVVDELGELRLPVADGEDRGVEVPVHRFDWRRGLAVMRAHDDLRRVEKVVDRGRFPQELGIVDDIDDVAASPRDDAKIGRMSPSIVPGRMVLR